MEYHIYIFIGICSIPILIYIIYFTRKLIERKKTIQRLNHIKKPLLEKINAIETEEVRMTIENIKRDISTIKEEITTSQEKIRLENKRRIEEQINVFYDEINNTQRNRETHQNTAQGKEDTLHKEQVRIMNQNIRKFLLVYKEKDGIIEEKNKSIELLQQKIKEIEGKTQENIIDE